MLRPYRAALPPAARLGQEPQDLQVQPDQRDHQAERAVPLHVLGRAGSYAVSMKSKSRIRFKAATTTITPLTTRLAVLFPWRKGIATWNNERTHPTT